MTSPAQRSSRRLAFMVGIALAALTHPALMRPALADDAHGDTAPGERAQRDQSPEKTRGGGEVSDASAAADALFQQGRALVSEGHVHEACPKLGASFKLDRKLGTLLNWADCLEKDGAIGSAFERFSEAADWARQKSDDRLAFAEKRRDALAADVPKLTLEVTRGAEKLEIFRGDAPISEESWGLAIPVDPGPISITVRRGDEVLERVDVVTERGKQRALALDLSAIAKAHPPRVREGRVPRAQRTAGFVVGGVGLAGLVAFGVLEGVAYGQKAKADAPGGCRAGVCTPEGYALHRRAGDFAEAGQWVGIGSAVVLAVGATLLITAPRAASPDRPRVGLVPVLGPRLSGVVLAGEL